MFPTSFIHRIQNQLKEADHFLEALSLPAITSIRKHPIKGKNVLIGDERIPWSEDGYYLKDRPVFTLDPHFHAGTYYVQESSSMFIQTILDQLFSDNDIRILDLCAAPGGKSTLIASWLNGNGLLVSNEVIKTRAQILLENITKWGYSNTWVTSTDPHVLGGGLPEFFDCILVDAPCSGEGLFRKDKSAIEEWSEANCDLCSKRQRKILADILPALNAGGYCIYSTCTFNPAENDENLQWMLKEFPLELVTLDISAYPTIQSTDGGYAFYPHLNKGEGFYCCVLRKTDEIVSEHAIKKAKINWTKANTKNIEIDLLVKESGHFEWLSLNENIFGVGTHLLADWNKITAITKVSGGYFSIGAVKGKDHIPDHALAMNIGYNHYFPSVDLTQQDALQFLSKKDFKFSPDLKGWHTIRYETTVLGFAKFLGNRMNNYYPTEWRIRMDV